MGLVMDGNKLIDNLLSYAVNHLYLNEYDLRYKKSVLCTVLKVKENLNINLTEDIELSVLVEQLKEFLSENKVLEADINIAIDYIFGLIMPLPSLVDRSFKNIREKFGAQKAFMYLYNLAKDADFSSCLDNNYIELETKKPSRIRLKLYSQTFYKEVIKNRLNECKITLDFVGNSYILSVARNALYPYQGVLSKTDNKPVKINENTLESMLAFIEYSPEFFISTSILEDNNISLVDKFFVGKDNLPFFKAKPHFTSKNEIYPDVEVAYLDWYLSTIRLASYNKNTLINSALEIIDAWNEYSDSKENVGNASKNYVSIFASMLADGRYAINLVLNNSTANSKLNSLKEKHELFFEKSTANSLILGVFTLNKNFENIKGLLINSLTKKQATAPINLENSQAQLNLLTEFVNEIIKEHGYFKDIQKCETVIFEELSSMCVELLESLCAFKTEKNNFIDVKRFLMSVKIK